MLIRVFGLLFCFQLTFASSLLLYGQNVNRAYNTSFAKDVKTIKGSSLSETNHKHELLTDWNSYLSKDIQQIDSKLESTNISDVERKNLETEKEQLLIIYNENLVALGLKKEEVKPEKLAEIPVKPKEASLPKDTLPVVKDVAKVIENPIENKVVKGTVYRLQFAALTIDRNADEVQKDLGIEEKLEKIQEENLFKYQFGNFTDLKEARASAEAFKNKQIDCFVVGYVDGKKL